MTRENLTEQQAILLAIDVVRCRYPEYAFPSESSGGFVMWLVIAFVAGEAVAFLVCYLARIAPLEHCSTSQAAEDLARWRRSARTWNRRN